MTKVVAGIAIALIGASVTYSAASAQTVDGVAPNCEETFFNRFERAVTYNSCTAAQLSRFRTIYVPYVVQHVVGQSFGFLSGPPDVEPAGLAAIVAGEADQRLASTDMTIEPAAATSQVLWNVWSDGRYLYSDYAASVGDLDGPTWSGMGGLDYKITNSVTLGLLVSADSTNLENGPIDSNSSSVGVGPYLGVVLTDNIVFSANVLGSWIDSDQVGGFFQFETDRVQAAAGLTGYWYKDTWRFTPGVTVSWSKDWEKDVAGLFLPDRTIEIAILTPSVQFGNTVRLSDTATVEPWVGAALDWTFLNRTTVSGVGSINDPNTDIRLQAGLNFNFNNNAQLAITGEMSGLLLDDVNSYSIAANLAFQL